MRSEDLLALKTWGQVVSGPDGQLFFVESQQDGEKNESIQRIMRMNRQAEDHGWTEPMAFTQGRRDGSPKISPGGSILGFISHRSGSAQLWVMALAGGEARQVTFFKRGISEFAWDPVHPRIVVIAHLFHGLVEYELRTGADKQRKASARYRYTRDVKIISRQYYKFDGAGYLDPAVNRAVLVDLNTEMFEVLAPGLQSVSHLAFSPDGERLYYLQSPGATADINPPLREIFYCDLHNGSISRLTDLSWNITRLVVHPGGRFLIFTASDPHDFGYGNEGLYLFDIKTHGIQALSESLDRPVGDHTLTDTGGMVWDDPVIFADRDTVVMNISQEGCVQLWEFGLHGQQPRQLSTGERAVYSFSRGDTGIVALWAEDLCPSVLGFAALEPQDMRTLARVEMPWSEDQLGRPQPLGVVSADGQQIDAWILLPDDLSGPVPAVFEIHGGPMALYGHRFSFEMQWLRAQGYAVVYGNPRGSLGYGHEFCQAIIGRWGEKDYADVMAIVDRALSGPQGPDINSSRLAIMGGSYGGFMVNWAISHTTRFCCAITMRSVVNRLSAMGTSDLGWLRVPQYGTKPWWEDVGPYWQQSPLQYASEIVTPLLIEHQMNDFRLPMEQAEQLYHALKYLGRDVKMMLYPDESHGMSRGGRPWHRVVRLNAIETWFRQYLSL